MSTDKRSVTTDALETLGTIIGDKERRDAIHLAVEPVTAGHVLWPGDHITVENGVAIRTEAGKGLGIVDPFLIGSIDTGKRFWFVMYPRAVHSLRHVWTHPAFTDETPVAIVTESIEVTSKHKREVAEAWLREFIANADCPDYDTVIEKALQNDDSQYLHFGDDAHGDIPDEFWDNLEIISGQKIKSKQRASHFSCSC